MRWVQVREGEMRMSALATDCYQRESHFHFPTAEQ